MSGNPKLIPLKENLNDEFDSYLLFSYGVTAKTNILCIQGEDFEPISLSGFDESARTVEGIIKPLYEKLSDVEHLQHTADFEFKSQRTPFWLPQLQNVFAPGFPPPTIP